MLGTAGKNPLVSMDVYCNAWEAFFGNKGPLPMLQHSLEWRAKLATLNKRLLQGGLLGGMFKDYFALLEATRPLQPNQ